MYLLCLKFKRSCAAFRLSPLEIQTQFNTFNFTYKALSIEGGFIVWTSKFNGMEYGLSISYFKTEINVRAFCLDCRKVHSVPEGSCDFVKIKFHLLKTVTNSVYRFRDSIEQQIRNQLQICNWWHPAHYKRYNIVTSLRLLLKQKPTFTLISN